MQFKLIFLLVIFSGLNCSQKDIGDLPVAKRITFKGQEFDTYVVDVRRHPIQMFWKDRNSQIYGSLGNLKAELGIEGKKLLFATNGGMFTPNQNPVGLYIENNELHEILDTSRGNGNFYLKPNGVFSVDSERAYVQETFGYTGISKFATQSGPMLVINGKLHPAFREGSKNSYLRSGVGLISPHKVVFAISREKCNFYDFGSLFKEHFKCKNALYLDGAISKMYCPDLDRHEGGGSFGVIIGITN